MAGPMPLTPGGRFWHLVVCSRRYYCPNRDLKRLVANLRNLPASQAVRRRDKLHRFDRIPLLETRSTSLGRSQAHGSPLKARQAGRSRTGPRSQTRVLGSRLVEAQGPGANVLGFDAAPLPIWSGPRLSASRDLEHLRCGAGVCRKRIDQLASRCTDDADRLRR